MDPVLAMSATGKCAVIFGFTGVVGPLLGVVFRRVGEGWDSVGKGPLAIDPDIPQGKPLELASPVNVAVQEAEARQMIEAKSYRRQRRGEAGLDVEDEVRRALAAIPARPSLSEALRAEVRELVMARNERRMRQGKEPLDVDLETERQLSDLIESGS